MLPFDFNRGKGLFLYDYAVVSTAPVPYIDGIRVALHGLRAWGLANSVAESEKSTILLTPQPLPEGGVQQNSNLKLISYNRGEDLTFVRGLARQIVLFGQDWETCKYFLYPNREYPEPIVIIDALVPMSIEYLGQWPNNGSPKMIENYLDNYKAIQNRNETIMSRADYLLFAGKNQEFYYQGTLASRGIFSPEDLLENRIINFPHKMIASADSQDPHVTPENFVLCWFGGLYPWIAPSDLAETFQELLEKNDTYRISMIGPINKLVSDAEPIQKYAKQLLTKIKNIESADRVDVFNWVPYEEINDHLSKVSAVLSLNPLPIEAKLSWRTRSLDILKNNIPMLTDGIDQIGQILIDRSLALEIDTTDPESIAESIHRYAQNKELLNSVSRAIRDNKNEFTYGPSEFFKKNLTPRKGRKTLEREVEYSSQKTKLQMRLSILWRLVSTGDIRSLIQLSRRLFSSHVSMPSTKPSQASNSASKIEPTKVPTLGLLVTPEVSYGGGNLVALDLMDLFQECKFPISLAYELHFNSEFFSGQNKSYSPIQYSESLITQETKLVIVNSLYHHRDFWSKLINKFLSNSRLQIFIYAHEDVPELFIDAKIQEQLTKLFKEEPNRIRIASPSLGTNRKLAKFFGISQANVMPLIYPLRQIQGEIAEIYEEPDLVETVKFCVIGSTFDDRKNHFKILEYFSSVLLAKHHEMRDFEVTFIGVGTDARSRELSEKARKVLGGRYIEYQNIQQSEVLRILRGQDVLISVSVFETLPKNITEALVTGNILIRNATSGLEEQLRDQVNGFLVDENDVGAVTEVILKILDPSKLSPDQFAQMKRSSRHIALDLINKSERHNRGLVQDVEKWLNLEAF
jgi:glycosyltransferase involved in cell wall biosynthesis